MFTTNDISINEKDVAALVFVPAGEFVMGAKSPYDKAVPQHRVYLAAFHIYQCPVTVEQYARFCRENRRKMPPRPTWGWRADHPVVNVTWHDATAYAEWAGASLPSEVEWMKAARGTDERVYPWGNKWDPQRCRCSREEIRDAKSTAPVTGHPSGASPYLAWDMAGNVWEWCADWYAMDYYGNTPDRNQAGLRETNRRALRGGGWRNNNGIYFHCAGRIRYGPDDRDDDFGFRCVCRPGSP